VANTLAIIVPVYNEEDNVLPLAREVTNAFADRGQLYQLVFVDDASTDQTWARIQKAQHVYPNVRGVRHQSNSGQSAAFLTGLRSTRSRLVATLDGDLQNDPADLPRMLTELTHADFVCGVRTNRQDNWLRRVSTRIARRARRLVLGVDFQDTGCFLRVFRRNALESVLPFNGWHRFLPLLVHGAGKSVRELAVNHRSRVAGTSKYGVWNRLWRGIYDLVGVGWLQKRTLRPAELSREASPRLPPTRTSRRGGQTHKPAGRPGTPRATSSSAAGRRRPRRPRQVRRRSPDST
jgi:glycosyltransferase involved in cell wall biosynthesis